MSTATLPPPTPVHSGVRLLTAADVAALPDRLPSGPVKYELHNGKLIVMAPPGDIHGYRQVLFGSYLFSRCRRRVAVSGVA